MQILPTTSLKALMHNQKCWQGIWEPLLVGQEAVDAGLIKEVWRDQGSIKKRCMR